MLGLLCGVLESMFKHVRVWDSVCNVTFLSFSFVIYMLEKKEEENKKERRGRRGASCGNPSGRGARSSGPPRWLPETDPRNGLIGIDAKIIGLRLAECSVL